nr:GtrA family protein [Herbaspirillum rubrisubalbicans]
MVGVLTVMVDFCTYRLLLWGSVLDVATAKTIGFLTGTVFAYVANRLWTFRHTQSGGSIPRFALLYACTLGINVCINSAVLRLAGHSQAAIGAAFILATGCSAVLNFLGMKFFVFKPSAQSVSQ